MNDRFAETMTHQPAAPNPAQPYVDVVKNYLRGGVPEVLKSYDIEVPASVDWFGRVLNNPDNQAAIGMPTPIKVRGELLEKLKTLMGQGSSLTAAAEDLQVTRQAAARALRREKMPVAERGRPTATIDWAEFARLRETGMDLELIAKNLGVTPRTLLNARETAGRSIRGYGAESRILEPKTSGSFGSAKEKADDIVSLSRQGHTLQEISERLGVGRTSVHRILELLGEPTVQEWQRSIGPK